MTPATLQEKKITKPGVMAQGCHPNTQEAAVGRSYPRPPWATHSEIRSQNEVSLYA